MPGAPGDASGAPGLPALVRRWEEAERRLYPAMLVDPDGTVARMRAVRAIADRLRAIPDAEALARAWERGPGLAREALAREPGFFGEAELELVAGAAFALRHRELAAEAARRERRRRIEEAERAGCAWVVLGERGVAGDPPAPYPQPYRRVEMRLVDGLGVHVFVEPDPDSEGALYGVEVLRLDPRSGEILGEGERVVLRDPAEWRRAIERARQRPGPDREPSDPPR